MNYCNIIHEDYANNLDGVGVTLFVSGCDGHPHCKNCHNPETWDYNCGILFDDKAKEEIKQEIRKKYIKTLTITGGDPLSPLNVEEVTNFVKEIKKEFPDKRIWLYTGFIFEQIKDLDIIKYLDVIVDGPFIEELRDETCTIKGSSNQRVIYLKYGVIDFIYETK